MDIFVKELGISIGKIVAVLWGLLSLYDNQIVESPLNQGILYSTVDWEGFIQYKADWHNIPVIVVDKWYPSSKMCCCCGHIKKNLKLSDRTYICPECGNVIDRDYQASVNLERYGETVYQQIYVSVS